MTTRRQMLLSWAALRGDDDGRTIKSALDVADRAHTDEFRRNGERYIEHSLEVAIILAENDADLATVTAGLLHDVPTARAAQSVDRLRRDFGDTVAELVAAVEDLDHDGCSAFAHVDQRASRIKVADRLHNMRTIAALDPIKQRVKADDTRELIAPLARLVGMADAATELDDLAAATLAACAPLGAPPRPIAAVGASLGALRLAAVLLPAGDRERWIIDWHGELHALVTRRSRLAFVLDVLTGLPAMAVLSRRTDHR